MNEARINGLARYYGIGTDAVRGFMVDMVAIGAAPDAESAEDAVTRVLSGNAIRVNSEQRGTVFDRHGWDAETDRMIDQMLADSWTNYTESPHPIGRPTPGYEARHAASE